MWAASGEVERPEYIPSLLGLAIAGWCAALAVALGWQWKWDRPAGSLFRASLVVLSVMVTAVLHVTYCPVLGLQKRWGCLVLGGECAFSLFHPVL